MNTDGTLFSMKKNSREAEAMSMTNGATPQLEEIDTTGADEYVKRKAIKTLLEAHLTTESPAQAWALAYRAAWNDALDFCIQAEQALDKKEDK